MNNIKSIENYNTILKLGGELAIFDKESGNFLDIKNRKLVESVKDATIVNIHNYNKDLLNEIISELNIVIDVINVVAKSYIILDNDNKVFVITDDNALVEINSINDIPDNIINFYDEIELDKFMSINCNLYEDIRLTLYNIEKRFDEWQMIYPSISLEEFLIINKLNTILDDYKNIKNKDSTEYKDFAREVKHVKDIIYSNSIIDKMV